MSFSTVAAMTLDDAKAAITIQIKQCFAKWLIEDTAGDHYANCPTCRPLILLIESLQSSQAEAASYWERFTVLRSEVWHGLNTPGHQLGRLKALAEGGKPDATKPVPASYTTKRPSAA